MKQEALALFVTLALAVPGARAGDRGRVVSDDVLQKISQAMPDAALARPAKTRKVLVYSKCAGFYPLDLRSPDGNHRVRLRCGCGSLLENGKTFKRINDPGGQRKPRVSLHGDKYL